MGVIGVVGARTTGWFNRHGDDGSSGGDETTMVEAVTVEGQQ